MLPLLCLGVDPGSTNTGYAVLRLAPGGEVLLASGTWRQKPSVAPALRHVANCQAIATLMDAYAPALVAYEEFRYRGRNDRVDPNETKWIDRLIGYILSLGGAGGVPTIVGLFPGDWGKALLGQAQHNKQQIAWAVNCRLGTRFDGSRGAHDSDACGVGLVALDRYRLSQRCGV